LPLSAAENGGNIMFSILLDESRRQNLDGSWNKYWVRKNRKAELRELKRQYRNERKSIKKRWKYYEENGE
jgi:hypothetical protein